MSYKNKVAKLRKKFRITGQYFGIFYNKKKDTKPIVPLYTRIVKNQLHLH